MFAFFPFRDVNRSRRFPYVSWIIIGMCVAVHGYVIFLNDAAEELFYEIRGFVPAYFTKALPTAKEEKSVVLVSPIEKPTPVLLPNRRQVIFLPAHQKPIILLSPITYMFIHAGLFHLIFNMWAFWIYGDNVEDRMGHVRFLLFYIFCGLAAVATHYVTHFGGLKPVVGASGALAGVMAAYLRFFPAARIQCLVWFIFIIHIIEVPALIVIVVWFIMQLSYVYASLLGVSGGNVAWYAHIGGFIAGAWLSGRWFPGQGFRFLRW